MRSFFNLWSSKSKSSRPSPAREGSLLHKDQNMGQYLIEKPSVSEKMPEILVSIEADVPSRPDSSQEQPKGQLHGRLRGRGPSSIRRSRVISNLEDKVVKSMDATTPVYPPDDVKVEKYPLGQTPLQQGQQCFDSGTLGLIRAQDTLNSSRVHDPSQEEQAISISDVTGDEPIAYCTDRDNESKEECLKGTPTPLSFPHIEEVLDFSGTVTTLDPYPTFDGTYSTIFKGQWDGSKVAIKVIRAVGSLATMHRKVRREREVWARLHHPNILPFYGLSQDFGMYGAFISPWCENGNVGSYIRQFPVEPCRRIHWWRGVINALVYLHSSNPVMIHGDLKPSNVLIDDDGSARVCDFGLVRILSEGRTGLTTTTSHTGTARYLAYELVDSDDSTMPTTQSDMHALGCLALEIIFLRSPYATCTTTNQIYKSVLGSIPPAIDLPATGDISSPIETLWDLLKACWNINSMERPSVYDVQEFVADHGPAVVSAFQDRSISISPILKK